MSAIALRAPRPTRLRAVTADGAQATLLAEFTTALTRALMQGVHDAASLNVATVHALLAPADGSVAADFAPAAESWRFSWRTYEIAATTAANVMRLSELHARRGCDLLREFFDHEIEGRFAPDDADALHDAIETLRAAQSQVFEAAVEVHRRLITLATQGAR